jgi:hypothetical protein
MVARDLGFKAHVTVVAISDESASTSLLSITNDDEFNFILALQAGQINELFVKRFDLLQVSSEDYNTQSSPKSSSSTATCNSSHVVNHTVPYLAIKILRQSM